MSQFDHDYINLCKKILNEGIKVHNRTGVDTIKIPFYNLEFDLQKEYPILTTKQIFIRQAVLEMLWIWQVSSNDVRWLKERNVNIWNEWMIDEDGIYRIYEPSSVFTDKEVDVYDLKGNKIKNLKAKSLIPGKTIKNAKFYGEDYAFTIGTAYGYIVKKYHLMDDLIKTLKVNKEDRRMVKSLWQDAHLKTAVLPSCVWSTEWDVTDGFLNLSVHQRSCDVPLGLPFNITQYATLLLMISQVTNLKPGKMMWSIKDAHIYENQIEPIKKQIEIYETKGDYPAPKVWINPEIKEFKDFDNSKDCLDIKLIDYKHHGKISFEITQ